MTSDAKIGLLLGLVFIFVIAFIINGLPNFGNRPNSAEATPMIGIEDDNLGVAGNAQEQLDWEQVLAADSEALTDFQPAVAEAELAADTGRPETAVAADTEDIRSEFPLDKLMGGVSRTIGEVVRNFGEASRSVTLQAESSELAPAIQTPALKPEDRQPVETTEPTRSVAKRATAPGSTRQIYVVQAGDVLATVAKKAYGPEEGNRLVNVKRIFEANRNALNSPDEIFVGQKLIIPPLPRPQAKASDKRQDALSEALFEKVQDIGKRNLADMKVEVPKGRYYVVQDGDSLWKIATSHLGNGARFEEILKLNTDILKSKDTQLDIGMRLRLPAK